MKRPIKFDNSFRLLLKQGFRGLFKFKVQFSIILILSFLATLILTISIGTTQHLQSNYNRIVKKVPRFAYSATTQIDRTALQNDGAAPLEDYAPIPLVDFINNSSVNALTLENPNTQADGDPVVTNVLSSYNFILNDDLYKDQLGDGASTFITKFMKNTGASGFYQLTNAALGRNATALDDQYKQAVGRSVSWQLIKDISRYVNLAKGKSLSGSDDSIFNFGDVSYLQTTTIAFLVINQPNFLDFIDQWITNNGGDGSLNLNPDAFNKLTYPQQQFIDQVYWTGILFGNWLQAEFARAVSSNTGGITLDINWVYQHFMGKPGDTGYTLKVAMNVPHTANNSNYLIVAGPGASTSQKDINVALFNNGYRGMTSPIVIEVDSSNLIKNIIFIDSYKNLGLADPKAALPAFNKILNWGLNFNSNWNPANYDGQNWWAREQTNQATMYQYHLQLTGMASGYDVTFRKESLFFDLISSRKFRYILQNGFDQGNFTILEGSMPSAVGEVAISQQFANSNKIKIGDYLSIGQTQVMVVAYGTDAFSFMPIVDPTVPIPEPKTGSFVYGSAQTLQQITNGFGGTSGNQDLTPHYYNYFLTDRSGTITPSADKFRLFTNLQMDLEKNLGYNYVNLNSLKPIYHNINNFAVTNDGANIPIPLKADVVSFWGLKDFNSSPYHVNWTIMPLVINVLKIVTYIASIVIGIIALIALVVCINKTIIANSKQMGILKALGLDPWKIAITYMAYGIVIMFIIVPIAWVIGFLLEIPFIHLFGTYFSVELLSLNLAWQAFLIAFLGFGILALIVSLVSAYLVLRRPVLEIFDMSVKWSKSRFLDFLKHKKFNKKSFNFRFSLTLASAGIRPILLLTTVIFLTSLLISGSLTIPAIANKAISSYYKNIRYANSYTNMAPTVNSPLSKAAINYWEGNEVWDKDWVSAALDLDGSGTKYGYYKNPKGYTDSVSQASVIPRYLYRAGDLQNQSANYAQTNIDYSYVFIAKNSGDFLKYVSNVFGDNFFTVLGQSFSIGVIDQFLGLVLNSDEVALREIMGSTYDDTHSLNWNKQQFTFSFMGSLAQGLPNIISQIIGAISGSVNPGNPGMNNNWKDQIVNAILTQVPPYIRNYIYKSPSRTEQFGISYNSQTYTPTKESIFTQVIADSDTYKGISLMGLDASQKAFVLPTKDTKGTIFLEPAKIQAIQAILTGENQDVDDIYSGNVQIWNKNTKTLTIPFFDNQQARSSYHIKKNPVLRNITTFGRKIKYRTNNGAAPWAVIPNGAWIYDDSDFANSDVYQNPNLLGTSEKDSYQNAYQQSQGYLPDNSAAKSYLDIYALDNNKFTYADLYNSTNNLQPSAYLFNDFAVDQNWNLEASYVRPYYMYKNIQLYLPLNQVNQSDILTSMAVENQGQGAVTTTDPHPWYDVITQTNVPSVVQNAWGNPTTSYLMIRPYDISYVKDPPSGVERITNGEKAKYWLRYAYDKDLGPGALSYDNNQPIRYGRYGVETQASDITVNLENVGTLNSYDSKLMIIDANLANLLNQYSLARAYGYQNSFFNGPGRVDNETSDDQPWPDKLVIYPLRNVTDDVYVNKENLANITYLDNYRQANELAPLRWNDGKYSNIEEPESLTSSVSFNVIDNLGQFSLGLQYPGGLGMTTLIKDQTLLSTQRALINQIFALSISLAALLIIAIVVTGSLLIMLMGDIYIAQYQTFMILMRALGYSNWEIQTYAFSVVSILGFIAWAGATIVAWVIAFAIIRAMSNRGIAIPYGLSWWPIVVSFVIIVFSYVFSLWVSSYKVRHDPVSVLMNTEN